MNPVVANNWSILQSRLRIISNGYRQAKPYNLSLPHQKRILQVTSASSYGSADISSVDIGEGGGRAQPTIAADIVSDLDAILAANQARARFRSSIGEQAGMLLNLAQRAQTMDMLTSRVETLVRFAQALRKGKLKRAARVLSIPDSTLRYMKKQGKLRGGAKNFANHFLEFHFGWEPLVKDIYSSMEILSSPPPRAWISASGRSSRFERSDLGSPGTWNLSTKTTTVRCRVSAYVYVSNPDAYLWNSLGLNNPLYVAWDAVPFSFVFDWFGNVGQFLNSFQGLDLAGLTLIDPITTYKTVSELDLTYGNVGARWGVTCHKHGYGFRRVLSIPSVQLRMPKFENRLSLTRGVTAISLLLQTLK